MSDNSLQAQIASIMGEARRDRRVNLTGVWRLALAVAVAIGVIVASAFASEIVQRQQPISDVQLRQIQGYVCLISEAGEGAADRLWHELKLFLDIEAVDKLRRGDYDRAIEWLDRRARRAMTKPGPPVSNKRFCGDLPG